MNKEGGNGYLQGGDVWTKLTWSNQLLTTSKGREFYTEVIFNSQVQKRRHLAHSKREKGLWNYFSEGSEEWRLIGDKVRSQKVYESESEVAQSCPTLCDPVDFSLPRSSIHGIFQARVLEWVAISFSRGSSQPRDRTRVSRIVGRCFTIWATREDVTVKLMRLCKISFILSVLEKYLRQQEGKKK